MKPKSRGLLSVENEYEFTLRVASTARNNAVDVTELNAFPDSPAMGDAMKKTMGLCIAALFTAFSIATVLAGSAIAQGNDRFPVHGEESLSPPSVQPPIYKCARAVSVYGFIPGATVDVYANVTEHVGRIHAPETYWPIPHDVKVSRPLNVGDVISATQTYTGITSRQSFDPVSVTDDPVITTPVVDQDLWECGQVVNVHNLRPSAHVEVLDLDASPTGTVIGTGESTSENLSVVTSKLVLNHHIAAVQIFCPGTPTEVRRQSAAQVVVPIAPKPPNPPTLGAPVPGSHTVDLHQLLVGSLVEVKNGTAVIASGLATGHDNYAIVNPPIPSGLPVGEPTATQALCDPSSPGQSPPEATNLSPIILGWPICGGSHYVTVWNARPDATIILVRGGVGVGYGSGSLVAVGSGITLNPGDDLTVVQQVGSLTSPPSNHVIVGCASSGNVVTQHNDDSRTGVYPYETRLTPSQVLARGMRVKYTFPVANQSSINGQPLYVRRVEFSNGGADGLFFTDTKNNVYAIDANTGSQKWHVSLADSDTQARGAATAIDTTPVIDVTTHRIYVVFSTNNNNPLWADAANEAALAARLDSAFWLVALDYTNGNEVARTRISASLYRNNGTPFAFDARFQRNHASLLMDHGMVYVAFGSIAPAEWTEFHGWVMAYRATDLGFVGAWCASKNFTGTNPYDSSTYLTQGGSGIWEGGGGLSSDADGNVYFLTGNGEADVTNDKYGDSFVKLKLTPGGLTPQTFVPSDAQRMFTGDADAGAGGTLTIPGTNLVIGGGKTGYMFLLNRSTMQAVQGPITASTSQYSDDNADSWRYQSWYTGPHLHGSPTYWRGPDARYGYLYVWGEKDYLRQYRFDTTTGKVLEPAFHRGAVLASDSPPPGNSVVMPGGIASLSSNSNVAGSGILWSTLPHNDSPGAGTPSISGHLYAFNAETLQHLWDVRFPSLGHWLPPTIADGKVFIGTGSDMLICYELGEGQGPHPIPWQPKPLPVPYQLRAEPKMTESEHDESMMFRPAHTFRALAPLGVEQLGVVEGDGVVSYIAGAVGERRAVHGWTVSGVTVRGSFTRHRALTPDKGVVSLSVSGTSKWMASDGSTATTVLERTVAAPNMHDAEWALYRVTDNNGRGMLADVSYILQAFTRGGRPPKASPNRTRPRASVPYHAQLILYKRQ